MHQQKRARIEAAVVAVGGGAADDEDLEDDGSHGFPEIGEAPDEGFEETLLELSSHERQSAEEHLEVSLSGAAVDDDAERMHAFLNRQLLSTFIGGKLYAVPSSMSTVMTQNPQTTMQDLMPYIERRDIFTRESRFGTWMVLEWDLPGDDVMLYYKLLEKQFVKHHVRNVILGITPAITAQGCFKYLALVRKTDYTQIDCNELTLNGNLPVATYCRVKVQGVSVANGILGMIRKFGGCVQKFVCGMELAAHGMTYSFEHLINLTTAFNDRQISCLFANITLTAEDNRNEMHWSLLKVEKRIMAYRATAKIPENIIFQNNLRGMVQPRSQFIADWESLPVHVADKSLIGTSSSTLGEWIMKPILHQNVALILRGPTRSGKSELSKVIAMMLAMKYQNDGMAHFVFISTIEPKDCKDYLEPGVPVVIDDVDPSDTAQLVHSSIGMWKALLQSSNPVSTRARNADISWARRQPKIITSNATSLDAWIGKIGLSSDRSHVEAVEMRIADWEVPGSLWANPVNSQSHDCLLNERRSHAEVVAAFDSMF